MYIKIYNFCVFFLLGMLSDLLGWGCQQTSNRICKASISLGCAMETSWAQFSDLKEVLSDI